jgi:hypothetical protein
MAKVENVFEVASQSLVLAPKTLKVQAFIYKGLTDLENLISFIGTAPKVNIEKGKMIISFGKSSVPDNSVILRTAYGEVLSVMTFDQAADKYDIAAQRDYDKAKDANVLVPKPVKTRTKK